MIFTERRVTSSRISAISGSSTSFISICHSSRWFSTKVKKASRPRRTRSAVGQVRRGRLREVRHQLAVRELQDLRVELLLALEVAVEQAGRDVGRVGDLLDARALVAALGEHLRGGFDELLAAHLRAQALAFRRSAMAGLVTCAPSDSPSLGTLTSHLRAVTAK